MTEHDPADVEYMARLYTAMLAGNLGNDQWTLFKERAIAGLDYMAARGEKVTNADNDDVGIWREMHDAAPLTPRDR